MMEDELVGGYTHLGDDDEDDDDDEEGASVPVKVYSAQSLLGKTVASYKARGMDTGGGGEKKKAAKQQRKAPRIWTTGGEYELFMRGPMLIVDPDSADQLQVRSLTLFRHTDPNVKFGQDPKRPLWKGVFRMSPELGYGEDQYYDPKQSHLHKVYATERPKKTRPVDNMIPSRREGGEALPYWVDDWYHVKANEQRHKQNSKRKRLKKLALENGAHSQDDDDEDNDDDDDDNDMMADDNGGAKATMAAAPKKRRGRAPKTKDAPATLDETVIPADGVYIMPLDGWLQKQTASRTAEAAIVSLSTILKQGPAATLGKTLKRCISQMGRTPVGIAAEAGDDDNDQEEDDDAAVASFIDNDEDSKGKGEPYPPLPSLVAEPIVSAIVHAAASEQVEPAKTTTTTKRQKTRAAPAMEEQHIIVSPTQEAQQSLPPPVVLHPFSSGPEGWTLQHLKMAKLSYISTQFAAWGRDKNSVEPAFAAFFSATPSMCDPDDILTGFLKHLGSM